MTVLTFLYVLASIRTNLVVFLVMLFIDCAFFMLMSSYWVLAEGRTTVGMNLQVVRYVLTQRYITTEIFAMHELSSTLRKGADTQI